MVFFLFASLSKNTKQLLVVNLVNKDLVFGHNNGGWMHRRLGWNSYWDVQFILTQFSNFPQLCVFKTAVSKIYNTWTIYYCKNTRFDSTNSSHYVKKVITNAYYGHAYFSNLNKQMNKLFLQILFGQGQIMGNKSILFMWVEKIGCSRKYLR